MAALTLGLWDGHEAGVAFIQDGALRFAQSEERFTRRKRASGFPTQALAAGLRELGITPSDVERIAVPGIYGRLPLRALDGLYRDSDPQRDPLSLASMLARRYETRLARSPRLGRLEVQAGRRMLTRRLRDLGFHAPLHLVDHHDAHAACARMGGLRDPLVVTMDGYGDGLCASFGGPGPQRETLRSPHWSLALVYGAVTRVLGFEEGEEGKTMGLAARGDPERLGALFDALLADGHCQPRLAGSEVRRQLFEAPREDVAAALQSRVETQALRWIGARRGEHEQLALAGGLFANVLLNGRLAQRFEQTYVFPHMGDGGLCVGAAAIASGRTPQLRLPFCGPHYAEVEIRAALHDQDLPFHRSEDPEGELLDTVAAGGIVGRCFGRSELGPRALGHRSILLRADRPELTEDLGRRLERETFMPFAPIRNEGAGSLTMTVVVEADATLRQHCPAAVHIDGTVRTQIVDPDVDPRLHRMLARAAERGLPALINTSFNRHREPIVETPADALRAHREIGLDRLQLGDYVVESARSSAAHRAR